MREKKKAQDNKIPNRLTGVLRTKVDEQLQRPKWSPIADNQTYVTFECRVEICLQFTLAPYNVLQVDCVLYTFLSVNCCKNTID